MAYTLDERQIETILSHFDRFRSYLASDEVRELRSQFVERSIRAQHVLSEKTVDGLSPEDIANVLEDLFRPEGVTFSPLRPIKARLKSLLWGKDPLENRFDRAKIPWRSSFWYEFTTFVKTQLLAWFNPDEYGMWNRSARRGLQALGLGSFLSAYKKNIGGKDFVGFNGFLKALKELMAGAHLPIESLVDVNLFLNFVSRIPNREDPLVEEEDLSLSIHRDYLAATMGLAGGFFGLAFVEIGLTASVNVYSLYGVAITLTLLGLFRGPVFQRFVVGKPFITIYRIQQITNWVTFGVNLPITVINFAWFYFAFTLAHGSIPLWAFVIFGISYLILATVYNWIIVLDRWQEGRLCLLRFLSRDSSLPEALYWLKKGMFRAGSRLKKCGVSLEPGLPLLGCCFAILNGIEIDQELQTIADWVATPSDVNAPWNAFETLLFYTRQAERTDIKLPLSRGERFAASADQLEKYLRLTVIAAFVVIIVVAAATGHLHDILSAIGAFAHG